MNPKVAMVGLRAPWGTEGGVEASVAELAPRLVRRGVDVTVYCRARYNVHGNAMREGVRLRDSPTLYGRTAEAFVHTALAVPRACLHHDLIHLHACGPAVFTGLAAGLGRKVVVTLHGMDWTRQKWGRVARTVLRAGAAEAGRRADAVITVSEELAQWVAASYPAPVHHIPNGVNAHESVQWDPTIFPMLRPGGYVLFLGRLVPEKDLETLVRAAARTRSTLKVVITGGATYADAYQTLLRTGAPDNVVFTGPRYGLEKRMLLTHARGFALPSRVEGLPIALLEAMAAGLPTVVSNIRPNLEVLGSVAGWRLDCGDVAAWARALEELDDAEPRLLERIGVTSRERVAGTFGWDPVADRTRAVYAAVLGAANTASPAERTEARASS